MLVGVIGWMRREACQHAIGGRRAARDLVVGKWGSVLRSVESGSVQSEDHGQLQDGISFPILATHLRTWRITLGEGRGSPSTIQGWAGDRGNSTCDEAGEWEGVVPSLAKHIFHTVTTPFSLGKAAEGLYRSQYIYICGMINAINSRGRAAQYGGWAGWSAVM